MTGLFVIYNTNICMQNKKAFMGTNRNMACFRGGFALLPMGLLSKAFFVCDYSKDIYIKTIQLPPSFII